MAKHTVKRKYMEATTEDRDAEFICSMIDKKMRAVESDSSECYDAKALLLFGNSLFPDNFRMKLQSYQIAKEAGDVDKAAQLFRAMYLSFPNEQSFYAELCAIIEEVRTEQQSKNTDMFQRLSKNLQCEILLKFCPTFANILDEIGLKVFIMRSYPLTIRDHAFDVIETLAGLEREAYPSDPLNVYRERLVCDVLPLVFQQMAKKKELDNHVASDLLDKALTFLLGYGLLQTIDGRAPLIQGSTGGERSRLKDPWLLARQLMEGVSGYHSWSSLALPRFPRPGSVSAAGNQTTEEFVLGLDQVLQNTRSPHRFALPLLVAHVESAVGYLQRTKASFYAGGPSHAKSAAAEGKAVPSAAAAAAKNPTKDIWMCCFGASSDDIRPFRDDDEENSDFEMACHWFGLALKIWRHVIRLGKEGRKDFDEYVRNFRTDAWRWLQVFYAEAVVLHGASGLRECVVSSEKVAALTTPAGRLFLDAETTWESQRKHAVSSLLLCLQTLQRAEPKEAYPQPMEGVVASRVHPVHLSFSWLFNFSIGLLLEALLPVCRRVTSWNHTAIGHALVLLQWDLSHPDTAVKRLETLGSLFSLVRQYGCLEYPRFFDFVINPELLEEVVSMQGSAARPVRMLLSPEMTGEDAKADAEELTKRAQLQVENSHNPIGSLLFKFLLAEAESLAECFS